MKIPVMGGACCIHKKALVAFLGAVVLCFCAVDRTMASSSGGEKSHAQVKAEVSAEGHGADAGHGEGHAVTKGWVETDTYRVMNFAVLAIGLFLLLKKPASQALKVRIDGIKDQLRDLEIQKEKAEKELAECNDRLKRLSAEAEVVVAQYVQQGEDARARILKEAEASAEKLEEQAKRSIENEFAAAKLKLKEEIIEKALVKAEAILRASVTNDDQDRLVDEYLEKVVA